ncbi:hypothetical protein N8J89_05755 [Crossiella sp. CA-258035]|uniref:hypothetical protein n=1 Tax=Crossiella sp. CA-258035 TaxID=2981138 RepID=UPI0024BC3D86|nr:hypothetical protein [Crossiella sp. CA-258035]WHT20572.1 hypothetical protein N8J89_05755 [Crossiella sp. CA-258035]
MRLARPVVALLLGVLYLTLHLGGECFVAHTADVHSHAHNTSAVDHGQHDCDGGHHDGTDELCLALPRGDQPTDLPVLPDLAVTAPISLAPQALSAPTWCADPIPVHSGQSIQLVNCVFRN